MDGRDRYLDYEIIIRAGSPARIGGIKLNSFKQLLEPCLVCRQVRPGTAFGITPQQAVCHKCYGERPDEVRAAFNQIDQINSDQSKIDFLQARIDSLLAQQSEIDQSLKSALAELEKLQPKIEKQARKSGEK